MPEPSVVDFQGTVFDPDISPPKQFYLTTAEDERNYFGGESSVVASDIPRWKRTLPDGTYRVIDGKLHRIWSSAYCRKCGRSL